MKFFRMVYEVGKKFVSCLDELYKKLVRSWQEALTKSRYKV